jgi:peptidoglycan/LPS O-acetylase OafA/YrhL
MRRARRLLPALWVMLVVVAVWVYLVEPGQLTVLRQDALAAFAYASNWWYVSQHVSYFFAFGPPSPLGHLWSLAVEEQFYLVWPLLLIAGMRLMHRRGALIALVLAAAVASATAMALLYQPGADPSRVYYGTDTRAFELLIGAALAMLWPSRRVAAALSRRGVRALDAVGACGVVVIVLMVAFTNQYQTTLYQGGLVVVSIAAGVVVAALVHPATLMSRAFGARPLRWIGVRSYGIYLWHYPVIVLTTPLVDTAGPHLVRSALQVAATLAIAALSWRFIEAPVRRGALAVWWRRVRAVRWPVAGATAGLAEATAVGALVVGALAAGVTGIGPAAQAAAAEPVLAVSLSLSPEQPNPQVAGYLRPSPAAADPTASPTSTPAPAVSVSADLPVTAIGDSIMVDVGPFLRQRLPGATIDGLVSRQMYQLAGVIAHLRSENRLAPRLVIELGTNGPFDVGRLVGLLRSLGPMDRIVLVNTRVPREWQGPVNQSLARVARQVPHTTVVDWYAASAGKPQYFWSDGVHPDPAGSEVLAGLIAQALS